MSKQKFVELTLLPHQVPYMQNTLNKGVLNATDPTWLMAFALYNIENKLRLSMEYDRSYKMVFEFIKLKLL